MNKIGFKKITLEKLAAIISEKLREHKIDSILVGGGCVSIYSQNRYQSYDLDYVTYEDKKKIAKVMNASNRPHSFALEQNLHILGKQVDLI